ncbi:MAG: choice-of-anchor D domain-containing protein [Burkholderiaceae bacterium]|nr:choice-of-anchor D domain-containing protein [Burkholderiaceae bacterium]
MTSRSPRLLAALSAVTLALLASPAMAQDASNGYRLWNFTSTIKGTAQSCASCHGENPRMPPNAMLVGVNIGTACGQAWPAGTAHALKTLCVIGASPTQAQAFALTDSAINGVGLMAQFRTPLNASERQDLAAFLLASHTNSAVTFARPEYREPNGSAGIGTLNFGSVNDGSTASRVVYFTNAGTAPMQIGAGFVPGSAVTGINAARFSVTTAVPAGETACAANGALAAGARCGLTITFAPDLTISAGALQTATLTIPSNGGSGISQLNLNGTRAVVAAPALALSPAGPDFSAGTTPAGTTAAIPVITVTNSGTLPLNFSAITIGGTHASDFTRSTTGTDCAVGTAVGNGGGTCTLRFTFAPPAGATGTRTATVDIASNATAQPLRLNLTGTVGTLAPTIAFGTTSNANQAFLRLQAAAVGAPTSGVVTVRNLAAAGGPSLTISNVQLATGAPTFSATPGTSCLAAPVAPGGSCTISVGYTAPDMAVPHNGTLVITSNGLTTTGTVGPHTVLLEGTVVVAGSGTTTAVSPDTRNMRFDNTPVNALSGQVEQVRVTNTGAAALVVQARLSAGTQSDFAVVNGCSSVAVGSSCTVQVQFRPRGEGTRSDTLTLTYNGGSLPPMALSGTGQAASAVGQGAGGGALPAWALLLLAAATMVASSRRRRH